ncbi:MAG TPA: hypothetical protein VN698_09620 [Bacteroidia bacterium]|nr:hypothetical protein [Bacteroidia bacterium]
MLKDKYTFKLKQHQVVMLNSGMNHLMEDYQEKISVEQLMLIKILFKPATKLQEAFKWPKPECKFTMNAIEALAFLTAYKRKQIAHNTTSAQIATEIDKTIPVQPWP